MGSKLGRFGGGILWLVALLAAGLPGAAMAYSPSAGDLSVALVLSKLFGSALPSSALAGLPGFNPLGGMIKVVNACALAIGGAMAAYTLVVGIMQTAHDGEVLGRKWSSMWLPIRTVLGLALVVPMSGGYCLAQFLLMGLVVQGVGMADSAWESFLSAGSASLVGRQGSTPAPAAKLAFDALQMQVCLMTMQNARAFPGGEKAQAVSPAIEKFTDAAGGGYNFGFTGAGGYHPGARAACGSIRYATWAEAAPLDAVDALGYSALAKAIEGQHGTEAAKAALSAHQKAVGPLVDAMGKIASGISSPTPSFPDGAAFDRAVRAYQDAISKAVDGVDSAAVVKSVGDSSAAAGWIWAGAWFESMGSALSVIDDAAKAVPVARSLPDLPELASIGVPPELMAQNLRLAFSYYEGSSSSALGAVMPPYGLDKPAVGVSYAYEESNRLSRWLGTWFAGVDVSRLRFDARHPIFVARELGAQVQSSLSQSVSSLGAAPSASSGLGGVQGPLIAGLMLPGFAAAAALSVWLPLIPLGVGLLAGLGWALLVVEAMVAAPLWAVMHLAPSGDDVMGSAKSGYAMMLALALRPLLTVMGFAAAAILSHPLGLALDAVFMKAYAHAPGSLSASVAMVAALCAQALALSALMWKCFSLSLSLPASLLGWMGAQAGAFAAGASAAASSESGAAGLAGSSGSSSSSGASGSGGAGALGGFGAAAAAGAAISKALGISTGYKAPVAARGESASGAVTPQMQEKVVHSRSDSAPMSVDKVEITANSAIFKDGEGGRASAGDIADLVSSLKDSVLARRDAGQELQKAGKPAEAAGEFAVVEAELDAMRSELKKLAAISKEEISRAELAMASQPTGSVEARRQASLARAAALALQAEAAALFDMSKASKPGSGGSKEMASKQQLLASSNAKGERADQMHARACKLEEMGFGSGGRKGGKDGDR